MSTASTSVVHTKSFNTLANKITMVRILTTPGVIIALLELKNGWAIGLLTFSVLTDFLDGLAARVRGERTKLGAFLDPLADKFLLTSVFLTLTWLGRIETWVFVVVFSRDLLIVLGWGVIHILTGSSVIQPRPLGKATTAVQMMTAVACVVNPALFVTQVLIWSTVTMTAASAVDYVWAGEKRLGEW